MKDWGLMMQSPAHNDRSATCKMLLTVWLISQWRQKSCAKSVCVCVQPQYCVVLPACCVCEKYFSPSASSCVLHLHCLPYTKNSCIMFHALRAWYFRERWVTLVRHHQSEKDVSLRNWRGAKNIPRHKCVCLYSKIKREEKYFKTNQQQF